MDELEHHKCRGKRSSWFERKCDGLMRLLARRDLRLRKGNRFILKRDILKLKTLRINKSRPQNLATVRVPLGIDE